MFVKCMLVKFRNPVSSNHQPRLLALRECSLLIIMLLEMFHGCRDLFREVSALEERCMEETLFR